MPVKTILFFDDFPLASENKLFLLRLRKALGFLSALVLQEKTIKGLEDQLSARDINCLVLDVMSAVPADFRSIDSGLIVQSSLAGVEVLRRCRTGQYGSLKAAIPVFMRTARGEPYLKRLCVAAGCSGYFHAGTDDQNLIEAILERMRHVL